MAHSRQRSSVGVEDAAKSLPDAWVVRAEKNGQHESLNFRERVASINWNDFPNPFTHSRVALEAHAERAGHGPQAPRQIWRFTHDIPRGALIVLPRLDPQHQGEVALGWCEGSAYRVPDAPDEEPNLRLPVKWIVTDMPRIHFSAATKRRFINPHDTVSSIRSPEVVADILQHLPREERRDEAR